MLNLYNPTEMFWASELDFHLPNKIIGFGWFGFEESDLIWTVDETDELITINL